MTTKPERCLCGKRSHPENNRWGDGFCINCRCQKFVSDPGEPSTRNHPGFPVSKAEFLVPAPSVQPLSTQDETAEQCDANYVLNRAATDLAAAEKELERLREATNELIHCVGKIAEQEGQEWRVAHPELIDAYSAATLAALGEAQKRTK